MEIPVRIAGEVGRHRLSQLIERRQPVPRGGPALLHAKLIRGLAAAVALALCAPASWSQASLARVDGRITDAGKPLSGGTVILKNQDTSEAYGGTRTDKDGRFCTPELARGTYIVDILNAAGDNVFSKTLQLTSAPRAPIRLDIDISGAPAGSAPGAGASPPASPSPAAQGSDSPAASGPACCRESWILPLGTYSQGPAMGPYSPGGSPAAPFSAVEVVSTEPVPAHGTAIHPMGLSVKIYRDSHGRSRREKPICSSLWEDAAEFLVSIGDPVAGYEYDLDPQNRIAYRYSLKALKDRDSRYFSAPAADGNRPGPHMEVTKEPLGSQMVEGVLAVGTRETRIIHGGAGDNRPPFTLVMEVWYSPDIGAVVLQKAPNPFGGELIRRLTNIDRREPDISLFQPPADYKIEDATGPVTINYPNVEVPPAGPAQARPEATEKPENKMAQASQPAPPAETPRRSSSAPAPGTIRDNPKDGLKYVWIPPGTFMMGCSPGDSECFDEEKPAHQVTLTKGFWIGQTEVTVAAYQRFAAATRRPMPPAPQFNFGWPNTNMPIVNVNWNDSQAFCQWSGGRLPTEAEWEYAARAGSTEARYGPLDDVAWYSDNSGRQRFDSAQIWRDDEKNYGKRLLENGNSTHEVAQKRANGFGLYDALGNVWEWVNDWYDGSYYQHSSSQDPMGPSSGQVRVLRGGSWLDRPRGVRVSYRSGVIPEIRYSFDGFRCVGPANLQ